MISILHNTTTLRFVGGQAPQSLPLPEVKDDVCDLKKSSCVCTFSQKTKTPNNQQKHKNSTVMEPTNNFLQTHKNGATHVAILIQIKKINKLSSGNNKHNDRETHPLPSANEDEWLFPFFFKIYFFLF